MRPRTATGATHAPRHDARLQHAAAHPASAASIRQQHTAAIARAALEAGISRLSSINVDEHCAAPDGGATSFRSPAVRFAVKLAEHLDSADPSKPSPPSTEGCYACLSVLHEMLPLLGPLSPVVHNVHAALQLCLLSDQRSSDGEPPPLATLGEGSASARGRASRPVSAAASPRQRRAPTNGVSVSSSNSMSMSSGMGGGGGGSHRVPYFVLVRKLEEAAAALRIERDAALEEVGRNVADLTNLDEQLLAAQAQLQTKTATIDKLLGEHAALEAELRGAREQTRRGEAVYEVLQNECSLMAREFLASTTKMEEELELLRRRSEVPL